MFFGPFMAISSHFSSHCALIFSWLVCGFLVFFVFLFFGGGGGEDYYMAVDERCC